MFVSTAFANDEAKIEDWTSRRREVSEKATRAFAAKDWQEAHHLYSKILEKEPDNPLILANLGAVEYQLGDLKACYHHLERRSHRLKRDVRHGLSSGE